MAPIRLEITLLPSSSKQDSSPPQQSSFESRTISWLEEDTTTVARLCQNLGGYCAREYFNNRPVVIRNIQKENGCDLAKHLELGQHLPKASTPTPLSATCLVSPEGYRSKRRKFSQKHKTKRTEENLAGASQNTLDSPLGTTPMPPKRQHSCDVPSQQPPPKKAKNSASDVPPQRISDHTNPKKPLSLPDAAVEDREEASFTESLQPSQNKRWSPRVLIPFRQSPAKATVEVVEASASGSNSAEVSGEPMRPRGNPNAATSNAVGQATAPSNAPKATSVAKSNKGANHTAPLTSPLAGPSRGAASSKPPSSTGKLKNVDKSRATLKQSQLKVQRYKGKGKSTQPVNFGNPPTNAPAGDPFTLGSHDTSALIPSKDKPNKLPASSAATNMSSKGLLSSDPIVVSEDEALAPQTGKLGTNKSRVSREAKKTPSKALSSAPPLAASAEQSTSTSRKSKTNDALEDESGTTKIALKEGKSKNPIIINSEDEAPPPPSSVIEPSTTEKVPNSPSHEASSPSSELSGSSGSSGSDISSHASDPEDIKARVENLRHGRSQDSPRSPSVFSQLGKIFSRRSDAKQTSKH